ncbi:MAG: hypothetical protein EOM25_06585 [Deltaproteobacteria bacterium]|nr:hypothetical protein [Deltaproteobacteria bacterium]
MQIQGFSQADLYTSSGRLSPKTEPILPVISNARVSSRNFSLRLGPATLEYSSQRLIPEPEPGPSLTGLRRSFADELGRQMTFMSLARPDSGYAGLDTGLGRLSPTQAARQYQTQTTNYRPRPTMISIMA